MGQHLKIMNKRMVLLNPKFANRNAKTASAEGKNEEPFVEQEPRSFSTAEKKLSQINKDEDEPI